MNTRALAVRATMILALAFSFFASVTNAQVRQQHLYLDDGAGNFTILTGNAGATSNITFPASGTLLSTGNTSSITSLGTISTGTWQGTLISPTYGGTGVNNGSNTITLGGNLTTSGANALTLTTTGPTNVTLPTSGTLLSTASPGVAVAWGTVLANGTYTRSYGMSGTSCTHTAGTGSYTLTLANSLQSAGANAIIIASPSAQAGECFDANVQAGYPTSGTSFFVYTNSITASCSADEAFTFVVYDHP